jgi:hypothetical protein
VDVGLHHRRIHPHSAPFHHPLVPREPYKSFVNLFDHFRPHRYSPAAHGLGIGRLGRAHAGEVAVYQVGAHFALQHAIAPVTDVLEDQQAQHHFGRSARPAAATALGMPFHQCFVHGGYYLLVRQRLIGVCHPAFAQIAHFLSDQSIAEAELRPSHLNHGLLLPRFAAVFSGRSKSWLISQIVSIVSFSF